MTTAEVLLGDGGVAQIRTLEHSDGPGLHALHEDASDDALRLRFFSGGHRASRMYVDRVLDSQDTMALVALMDERVVALATAEPVDAASAPSNLTGRTAHRPNSRRKRLSPTLSPGLS